jgi:hypothetical protein
MLQTISDHPGFTLGIIAALMTIITYFIRKVLSKIDTHTETINAIKLELVTQLSDIRVKFREDMTVIFNNTCEERQGSCARLQQAKLDTLTSTHVAICAKLGRLDTERREAWSEQRRWNDKIETNIYKDKGSK